MELNGAAVSFDGRRELVQGKIGVAEIVVGLVEGWAGVDGLVEIIEGLVVLVVGTIGDSKVVESLSVVGLGGDDLLVKRNGGGEVSTLVEGDGLGKKVRDGGVWVGRHGGSIYK